jgi:hypothetical protein
MILAVDDGDADGRAGQRLGCVQSTEAGTHDYDTM